MKKLLVCWFVTLLLFMSISIASADTPYIVQDENFSIRSGIHFGATKAEIDTIEKNNGNEYYDVDVYYGETYDLAYYTTLAGYESTITYWTDENGVLDEFQYVLYREAAYQSVKAALVNKYGAPMQNALVAGTGIDRISQELKILEPYDKDYACWVVKYNDCFLIIETKHIYFPYDAIHTYIINYDVVSYDEMKLLEDAYDELVEYINNSFENDL